MFLEQYLSESSTMMGSFANYDAIDFSFFSMLFDEEVLGYSALGAIFSTLAMMIQRYHTDNGISGTSEFVEELLVKQQTVRYSGINTPHKNAVAERAIQTIVYMARTMMLHVAMRAPEGFIKAGHWLMAMDQAM